MLVSKLKWLVVLIGAIAVFYDFAARGALVGSPVKIAQLFVFFFDQVGWQECALGLWLEYNFSDFVILQGDVHLATA